MESDILIVGGGIIGLSLAVELRLLGSTVTVISRDSQPAATMAAAGMLAPEAEGLPAGPMLDLALTSRALYPEWTRKLEELTGLSSGYWPCGILAPVYKQGSSRAGEQVRNSSARSGIWLDFEAIHQCQSGLGADVIGGWWFPEDAQVDSRALARTLRAAAEALGVNIMEGVTVEGIEQHQGVARAVQTSAGKFSASQYVLAAGAWSNELWPLPVYPKKGQMLSVRVPPEIHPPLRRVLFGEQTYIVPRRDGQIIIGATSEDVGFTPQNTPAGIQALLANAIRLYPALKDFPIAEFWWGFRPATPDEMPILGASPMQNLTFATGHYRNGILLAPITAKLLADYILQQKSDPLLDNFHYSRFYKPSDSPNGKLAVYPGAKISTTSATEPMQVLDRTIDILSDRPLTIAGKTFNSRLMTGTGKYRNIEEMQQSIAASGCQIVTVAVRRVQSNAPGHEGLAEALDWKKIWMLPNTAGCKTADEAIRVARLGREMAKLLGQEDNNFVKLEVIPDGKYLLPDPIGTLAAAEQLVKEGFAVLPYINADPMLAKRLEEVGCATVMPLGSPIGSGQGLKTVANLEIIIENAGIPVVVDAGIGTPSEAAQAMELGADALLINTAIAQAKHPPAMARAMNLAAEAGRLAYLAGRIPVKSKASASSPLTGTITGSTS
ncbi:glycine oxidase ThiO [Microseira wollei]|uniref:glycine oxidase ThiO n=1 Tax=Microseira wollei TaxID=467598 RepID=UPI00403A72B3